MVHITGTPNLHLHSIGKSDPHKSLQIYPGEATRASSFPHPSGRRPAAGGEEYGHIRHGMDHRHASHASDGAVMMGIDNDDGDAHRGCYHLSDRLLRSGSDGDRDVDVEGGVGRTGSDVNVEVDMDGDIDGDVKSPRVPWSLCLVVCQNCFMDGLLIGIAAAADDTHGGEAGWLLSISLALDGCFMGVNTAGSMQKQGIHACKIFLFCILSSAMCPVGGLVAFEIVEHMSEYFFIGALAFGVAGLLFIVSEEYLVEAHEDKSTDTWYVTINFFTAFALVLYWHLSQL